MANTKAPRCECGHYSSVHRDAQERPKRAAYCGSCKGRKAQHPFKEAVAA